MRATKLMPPDDNTLNPMPDHSLTQSNPEVATATANAALNPVLNDPFSEPTRHWEMDENNRATDKIIDGRRESLLALPVPQEQIEGEQANPRLYASEEINQTVQQLRALVGAWRSRGYAGATSISKQLLDYWTTPDDRQGTRLFFAQVEAMETLIFLTEVAPEASRGSAAAEQLARILDTSRQANLDIDRLCVKMATGSGKTAVMGMTIAWHTLNSVHSHHLTEAERARYQTSFLVMAPGLTVKERLEVLYPAPPGNIYDDMNLVPQDLRAGLNTADVVIHNFQRFQRSSRFTGGAKKLLGVGKTDNTEGAEAMLRRILKGVKGMGHGEKICVINDEAHHCYWPDENKKTKSEDDKQAALWFSAIKGLDDLGHLGAVYDYSATPLFIATAARQKTDMFPWVVSDYPLTDAIEAGLVKIPRFPVADDSETGGGEGSVKWRNLYKSAKQERGVNTLDRSDIPHVLRDGVKAVYDDYKNISEEWQKKDSHTPPVMIFVANDIKNAETFYTWLAGNHAPEEPTKRTKSAFDLFDNAEVWADLRTYLAQEEEQGGSDGDGPSGSGSGTGGGAGGSTADTSGSNETEAGTANQPPPPVRTLLVHSRIESEETGGGKVGELLTQQAQLLRPGSTKKDAAHIMREALNSVGKRGGLGENVRCVVSVAMLTEGWDTKTVTHVVGYRAFGTQLLCEQVTGRALRRTTYDSFDDNGHLTPQFAEVIGIPFDFAAHTTSTEIHDINPPETYEVRSLPERRLSRVMHFPRVVGYVNPIPTLDVKVEPAEFAKFYKPAGRPTIAVLAGIVGDEKLIANLETSQARLNSAATRLTAAVVRRLEQAWLLGQTAGQDEDDVRFPRRGHLFQQLHSHVRDWLVDPTNAITPDKYYLVDWPEFCQAAVDAIYPAIQPVGAIKDLAQLRIARFSELSDVMTTDNINFESSATNRYPHDTTKQTKKSHLNLAVCDSQLEVEIAKQLDTHKQVDAWVRNFRLGWTIPWYNEARRRWSGYVPDFVARIGGGLGDEHAVHLIIEGKGVPDASSEDKKMFAKQWWIPAVQNSVEILGSGQHWDFVELTPQQRLTDGYTENMRTDLNEAIDRCVDLSEKLKQKTT